MDIDNKAVKAWGREEGSGKKGVNRGERVTSVIFSTIQINFFKKELINFNFVR